MIVIPSPLLPAYGGVTSATQWLMMESTATLKIMGTHEVALHYTLSPLERASEVPAGLRHNGQSVPVRLNKYKRPGTDPVCREKFHVPFLVQGIVGLLEIQKDLK